jgi:hypothetical protein
MTVLVASGIVTVRSLTSGKRVADILDLIHVRFYERVAVPSQRRFADILFACEISEE